MSGVRGRKHPGTEPAAAWGSEPVTDSRVVSRGEERVLSIPAQWEAEFRDPWRQDTYWDDCWQDCRLSVILRVLFMPVWFRVNGSPESWWRTGLERAMEAVEDLCCLELLETQ